MKTNLRDYQKEAVKFAGGREFFANLLPPGLGKTLIELYRIWHLRKHRGLTGVLYICPKSIYPNIQAEFEAHWNFREEPLDIVFWTGGTSQAYQFELRRSLEPWDSLKVAVVNVEAFSHERVMKFVKRFAESHNQPHNRPRTTALCVIDESSRIKFNKAKRTKHILSLSKLFNFRDIMTGTPVLERPVDLWTQCQFLHPMALGERSFVQFRYKFCQTELCRIPEIKDGKPVIDRFGRRQWRTFYKVTGGKNLTVLRERLYGFSFRKEKHEVLSLPEKVYQQRYIELTSAQNRLYKELKKETLVKLETGEVDAQNAVVTLTRLQQLLCGYLTKTDKTHEEIESNRISELLNVLEEIDEKVLIWCHLTKPLEDIIKTLSETYGPQSVIRYDGATSTQDRELALVRLKEDKDARFFVSNPNVGGIGLTLNAATTSIYYINSASLETRLQSEDRNHRIGTTGTVTVIDFVVKGTLDERLLQLLKSKSDLATEILGDSRKLLNLFNEEVELPNDQ